MDSEADTLTGTLLGQRTGHSRRLRERLRARRMEMGLSAREVAARMATHLDVESVSLQSVYDYEAFKRHPAVDKFAAWARVLGFRLVVDLDDNGENRTATMLRYEESVSAAKTLDAISDPDKRQAALQTLKALLK